LTSECGPPEVRLSGSPSIPASRREPSGNICESASRHSKVIVDTEETPATRLSSRNLAWQIAFAASWRWSLL
jgi:hypothetical protein